MTQMALDLGVEISDKQLVISDVIGAGGYATVYKGEWEGDAIVIIQYAWPLHAYVCMGRTGRLPHVTSTTRTEAA
jgi:hypothetical protein